MSRGMLAIVVPLLAVILLHDLSMAIVGHPAAAPGEHTSEHAHQRPETPAPEACEIIRIQHLRLPDSDLFAGPDVRPFPAPSPVRWSASAISDTYLVASVIPPPSACLALFQAFLI